MILMTLTKTKINLIWEELEKDDYFQAGLLYKRYSLKVDPDVFVALKSPEKLRCIAFRISYSSNINLENLNKLRDIKLELMIEPKNPDKQLLLVILLNSQYKDIFSTLCQDLIAGVSKTKDESSLIDKLAERLLKWQSLFEKLERQGLSDSSQRGLYGELYFLRKYLLSCSKYIDCLNSWMGPEKAVQDFQYSKWAIEVKTTSGNNHQKISISSERQLDDSIIPYVYLYHISLDIRKEYGESLNEITEDIFEILSDQTVAINLFKMKLMEAGYFDFQKGLYGEKGYTIRNQNIYHVTENFPRITEKKIPLGVGDVTYSIMLDGLDSWRIDESTLFAKISEG
jgi:hypothetical protein